MFQLLSVLSVVELLLESVGRREHDDAPDSKRQSQGGHDSAFPVVGRVLTGRCQSAGDGNTAEHNPRHCVREGLTIQQTLHQDSDDEAKQGGGSHNEQRFKLSGLACETLRLQFQCDGLFWWQARSGHVVIANAPISIPCAGSNGRRPLDSPGRETMRHRRSAG